jgi:hypothetical protein
MLGGRKESLIIRPIASATAEGLDPIEGRDALEFCSADWMLELSRRGGADEPRFSSAFQEANLSAY